MSKLKVLLIKPRGFCAGVRRAIEIVNISIERFGTPLYVVHDIVHNFVVTNEFKKRGVIFLDSIHDLPQQQKSKTVIFSAHGISKQVTAIAVGKKLNFIDAVCPIVKNVHTMIQNYHKKGYSILLIGHRGHPEIKGTMGQIPEDKVFVIEGQSDIDKLPFTKSDMLAYVTQTTLSISDTAYLIKTLKKKYPNIQGLANANICYATTNRQLAVKSFIKKVDAFVVVGSYNSSNTMRLFDIAKKHLGEKVQLIQTIEDLNVQLYKKTKILGITAGASAPEELVTQIMNTLSKSFDIDAIEVGNVENISFDLPKMFIRNDNDV